VTSRDVDVHLQSEQADLRKIAASNGSALRLDLDALLAPAMLLAAVVSTSEDGI